MFGMHVGWTWLGCSANAAASCPALDSEFDDLKSLGVKWVRADFPWSVVQAGGANSYDWGRSDRLVNEATSRGMSVLGVLDYSPAWAALNGSSDDHTQPANPAQYAAYAAAAAARYNGRVGAWEIWNEPNSSVFFKPQPNPAVYTNMLKQAYPAIKAVSAATVITAGPAPCCNVGNVIDYSPPAFLQQIYNNGGKNNFDGVGWHPYTDDFEPPTTNQQWSSWWQMSWASSNARGIMAANGDSAKQIWMTEFGFTSSGSKAAGETNQSNWLSEAYNLGGSYGWTGPMFWYEWKDEAAYGASSTKENYFGLRKIDGTAKPAWTAYKALALSVSPDTSAPTAVKIVTPATGSNVAGSDVIFSANAADDRGVTKVDYYINGSYLASATASPQYGWIYHWNSTSKPDANYSFTVKAFDSAGNSTLSPAITLSTHNAKVTPPTGGGSSGSGTSSGSSGSSGSGSKSPGSGGQTTKTLVIGGGQTQEISGDVNLAPSITDPSSVLKVEYYVDSKLVFTATDGDFSYHLDTKRLSNGKHTVETRIYNVDGTVTSKSQNIVVNNKHPHKLQVWWLLGILALLSLAWTLWRFKQLGVLKHLSRRF
ncbi:MAG: beta-xylosidase [Candidatus Saccharibacteria bacterium]|nr:beta-xylosidase [Candidatus Saccharibacteria bacterium]